MSRNILSNLDHSYPKQQLGFSMYVFPSVFTSEKWWYIFWSQEVRNAVIRQGNEPTDILIDFEIAAVNPVTNQMPQLQVLKVNFNLIYGSCVFISTWIFNRFLFRLLMCSLLLLFLFWYGLFWEKHIWNAF